MSLYENEYHVEWNHVTDSLSTFCHQISSLFFKWKLLGNINVSEIERGKPVGYSAWPYLGMSEYTECHIRSSYIFNYIHATRQREWGAYPFVCVYANSYIKLFIVIISLFFITGSDRFILFSRLYPVEPSEWETKTPFVSRGQYGGVVFVWPRK